MKNLKEIRRQFPAKPSSGATFTNASSRSLK